MTDPTDDMLCLQDFDDAVADFYRLKSPNVPWGDYGRILVSGLVTSKFRDPGPPDLKRTGPFVPPVSFPGLGCVIVTDTVRGELESSGLTGLSFIPAMKKVIVSIDWHKWDLLGEKPPFYPKDGEPESYLSDGEHSPELARRMSKLWRVVIAQGATEIREPEGSER